MNKIDEEYYQYLKNLSHTPRNHALDKFRIKNTKDINNYMEGPIWEELHSLGYVSSSPNVKYIFTPSGLEQLRMLEDIRRKDSTLIVSIIALIISLVALAKSMGWI